MTVRVIGPSGAAAGTGADLTARVLMGGVPRGGRHKRPERHGPTTRGSGGGGSWSRSSLEASGQVHTLVQDGDDKGFPPTGTYVEDVVMPAVHDPHLGTPVRKGPGDGRSVTDGVTGCTPASGSREVLFDEGVEWSPLRAVTFVQGCVAGQSRSRAGGYRRYTVRRWAIRNTRMRALSSTISAMIR